MPWGLTLELESVDDDRDPGQTRRLHLGSGPFELGAYEGVVSYMFEGCLLEIRARRAGSETAETYTISIASGSRLTLGGGDAENAMYVYVEVDVRPLEEE